MMFYAVIIDVTPNRATVVSSHCSEEDAIEAAESTDTGVNGMPAQVMSLQFEPTTGDRIWHDGEAGLQAEE